MLSAASAASAAATGTAASRAARGRGRVCATIVSASADAADRLVSGCPARTVATVAAADAHSAVAGANRRPAIAANHTTAAARTTTGPWNADAVTSESPMVMVAET